MNLRVVPASPLHVGPVAMKSQGLFKMLARGGKPRAELRRLMSLSLESWTALLDDRPIAMWGVIMPTLGTEGYVWLCLSDEARSRVPKAIVRLTREFLSRCLVVAHKLVGLVDLSDQRAVRFAQFMGFEVIRDGGQVGAIRMTR